MRLVWLAIWWLRRIPALVASVQGAAWTVASLRGAGIAISRCTMLDIERAMAQRRLLTRASLSPSGASGATAPGAGWPRFIRVHRLAGDVPAPSGRLSVQRIGLDLATAA
jgi:hypothetical protein